MRGEGKGEGLRFFTFSQYLLHHRINRRKRFMVPKSKDPPTAFPKLPGTMLIFVFPRGVLAAVDFNRKF